MYAASLSLYPMVCPRRRKKLGGQPELDAKRLRVGRGCSNPETGSAWGSDTCSPFVHTRCVSRQGIIQVRIPTVAASRRLWSRWQVSNTSVCASLAVVRTAGPLWHACMRAGAAGAQRFRICASPRLNGTYNTIDDAHHVKTVLLPNMLRDKYIYSRKKPGMRR